MNLDSADHRAHMAYTKNGEADGECPGTHPVRLPQIAVFTRVAPYAGGIHLFSDGTGYFHADYFSGWEAAQLQKVLDECENDSMQSAPDAWCEDHVTFRDAPKSEDVEDEELREKLVPFQPAPFDATRILSEAVDGVTDLPGGLQPVIDPTASTATNTEEHCFADASNTFHVWVDPYASELGSWKFLECGDTPMPILAVEKGVTYTFEQFDALGPARKMSAVRRRRNRDRSKTQVELVPPSGVRHGARRRRGRSGHALPERRADRRGRLR